jgi:hypothetical protein
MRAAARLFVLALPLALAGLSGCIESRYYYRPTEHATAHLADSGLPAALYQVPADRPQGEVKLATLGVHELEDDRGSHLVVRMIVTNNSDAPWRIDLSQLVATFPDGERRLPERAWGPDQLSAPEVWVPARQERSLDLIYRVPEDLKLKYFQLAWAVATPSRLVTQRTNFRREEPEPAYYGGYGFYGYGPYYPFYPYGYWFGPTVLIGGRVGWSSPVVRPLPAPRVAPPARVVPAPPPGR